MLLRRTLSDIMECEVLLVLNDRIFVLHQQIAEDAVLGVVPVAHAICVAMMNQKYLLIIWLLIKYTLRQTAMS